MTVDNKNKKNKKRSQEDDGGNDEPKRIKIEDESELSPSEAPNDVISNNNDEERPNNNKRWRAHCMMEDYIESVGQLMMPGTTLNPHYAERVTALGYLTSPSRRKTIWEDWSPRQVALFEAGILQYGKDFSTISNLLEKKETKDVVAFYYVWKKTRHYQEWKRQYQPDDGAWVMDTTTTTSTTTTKKEQQSTTTTNNNGGKPK